MQRFPVGARPVLAGVDGGAGTAAVVRSAARLATAAGAELLVVHVLPPGVSLYPEMAALTLATTEEDLLAELLPDVWEMLIDCCVRWQAACVRGSPAQQLVRLSRAVQPSAIVVGADTPGWRGRLRRGLSGSIPTRLQRGQDAPVIVIPAGCSHRRHSVDRPPAGVGS